MATTTSPDPKPGKLSKEAIAASKAKQDAEAKSTAQKMGLKAEPTSSRAGFKKLFGKATGRQRTSYPTDLLAREHYYVRFEAVQRVQQSRKSSPKTTALHSINLPLPAEIATAYAQSYTNVESMLGAFDTGGGFSVENARKAGAALAKAGANKVAGGSLTQAIGLSQGVAVNPHMAVLFQGTEFRSHQFTYKMTALSQPDAHAIESIVRGFKYFSSPILTSVSYTFPDEWFISFMGGQGELTSLFKIGRSVLKNVQVTYGTESSAVFTRDDMPLTVTIALEFQETELVTKEQIEGNY